MKSIQHTGSSPYLLRYPLNICGAQLGRAVSIFRLESGSLVLHSTGPFSENDRGEIMRLGEVAALVDVTNFHDTFAELGSAMFPQARYFAPNGFPHRQQLKAEAIENGQDIWGNELVWIPIDGVPRINEWACFHPQSKTLVLADLIFNCRPTDFRGKLFFALAGIRGWPGNCRLFRMLIRNRNQFEQSIRAILALDFERLVVAHGDPVEEDAKEVFTSAVKRAFPWMKLEM